MKILELMLKNKVDWPDGAEFASQDKRMRMIYFYTGTPTLRDGERFWSAIDCESVKYFELSGVATDWATSIITREQYEAAVSPIRQVEFKIREPHSRELATLRRLVKDQQSRIDDLTADGESLNQEISELRFLLSSTSKALQTCADKFREYSRIHAAKPDLEKAEVNLRIAEYALTNARAARHAIARGVCN